MESDDLSDTTFLTEFDNPSTIIYKMGSKYNLPIKFVFKMPLKNNNDEKFIIDDGKYGYNTINNKISPLFDQINDPKEILEIAQKYTENIKFDDLICFYYEHLESKLLPEDVDPSDIDDGVKNIILDSLNKFYRLGEGEENKYGSYDDFMENYDSWDKELEDLRENDKIIYDQIVNVEQILIEMENIESVSPIKMSPLVLTTSELDFTPKMNGEDVAVDDGLDIFNSAIPSKHVPYIQYNNKYGKSYYRIYTGEKVEDIPNFSTTIIPKTLTNESDHIYMRLWIPGNRQANEKYLKNATKESLFVVTYSLTNNIMKVAVPSGESKNMAINIIKNALPSLSLDNYEEVKVRGEMDIYNIKYEEISLLDMILLDPIINRYLYIEEHTTPFYIKKRLDIHYRPLFSDINEKDKTLKDSYVSNYAAVSLTLNQKFNNTNKTVNIQEDNGTLYLQDGDPYIHINISKAESKDVVLKFTKIFKLLLIYYGKNYLSVYNDYVEKYPQLELLAQMTTSRKKEGEIAPVYTKRGKEKNRTTNALVAAAPDLFIEDYSRKCPVKRQPRIIEENQLSDNIQAIRYPENGLYYTCEHNDQYRYAGLQINKLPNNDKYEFLPCCFGENQLTKTTSGLKKYQEGLPLKTSEKIVTKDIIKTDKILVPGKIGKLPRAINTILKNYNINKPGGVSMYRYGIINSPNSLLHCICLAIGDKNYLKYKNDDMVEDYIKGLRKYISTLIHPGLLKQELYDYQYDEIEDILKDEAEFLDPALTYRAFEEIFNINIFVFYKPKTEDLELQLGAIDIPRFKLFHARTAHYDRPTVLIFKNQGSDVDNALYPQCELIVDLNIDESTYIKLFGENMTKLCYNTLTQTNKTITWLWDNRYQTEASIPAYSNIYYNIDILNIIKYKPIEQLIDNDGKLRGITFIDHEQNVFTVSTLPLPPLNLPIMKTPAVQSIDYIMNIIKTEPDSVTYSNDNKITGLWYSIYGIKNSLYVPVIPFVAEQAGAYLKNAVNMPGSYNPIITSGDSSTKRINKLKRSLNIIIQILRWLYDIKRQFDKNLTPEKFAEEHMAVVDSGESEIDSANYYILTNLTRRLPSVKNITEGFEYLNVRVPKLVTKVGRGEYKIVMYNRHFLNGIVKMLTDYNNLVAGTEVKEKRFIDNFYEVESDFINRSNSRIIIGEIHFNQWYSSLSGNLYSLISNSNDIKHKIETPMSNIKRPFLFQDNDFRMYIVQNVETGRADHALAVCKYWYEAFVNIGYKNTPTIDIPAHMIFCISSEYYLEAIADLTNGSDVYVKILYYGNAAEYMSGKGAPYAALLPL